MLSDIMIYRIIRGYIYFVQISITIEVFLFWFYFNIWWSLIYELEKLLDSDKL